MEFVSRWGLLAVFLGTFAEGETILFTAGILASQGALPLWGVVACAASAATIGHAFWFVMGRRWGGRTLRALRVPDDKVHRVNEMVMRHPVASIVLLQYLYGLRLVGAVMLGVTTVPLGMFAAIEAVNCVVWAVLVAGAGYQLGTAAQTWLTGPARWIGIALTAVVLFLVVRAVSRSIEKRV